MSSDPVRIGVVDSGSESHQCILTSAAFVLQDNQLWLTEAQSDKLKHGSRIIDIIQHLAPEAELLCAQVFFEHHTTSAAQVAAAIDWLVEQGSQLINLSLGLQQDRDALREACERALRQGVILCAASPARGVPVYPAAYPGVFRMTGDARCERDEISHLETELADFGACVRPLSENLGQSGASMGCAHLSALVARCLQQQAGQSFSEVRDWLVRQAVYQGPERRT